MAIVMVRRVVLKSSPKTVNKTIGRYDFHSHILPKFDDGSKSSKESVEMLEMLSKQQVETVCLTPHYYHHRETVSDFLRRRDKSAEALMREVEKQGVGHKLPEIVLGAEIKVESELLNETNIKKLCYSGTNSLLLEMPFVGLESRTVETMENLAFRYDLKIIIAHLNRYLDILSEDDLERVINIPNSIVQVNAEAFLSRKLRKYFLKLFEAGIPIVLGSDAHGMSFRKPEIEHAYSFIENKLSGHSLRNMSHIQHSVTEGCIPLGIK